MMERGTISKSSGQTATRPCSLLKESIKDIPSRLNMAILLGNDNGAIDSSDHMSMATSLAHRFILVNVANVANDLGFGFDSPDNSNTQAQNVNDGLKTPLTLIEMSSNVDRPFNDLVSSDEMVILINGTSNNNVVSLTFDELFADEEPTLLREVPADLPASQNAPADLPLVREPPFADVESDNDQTSSRRRRSGTDECHIDIRRPRTDVVESIDDQSSIIDLDSCTDAIPRNTLGSLVYTVKVGEQLCRPANYVTEVDNHMKIIRQRLIDVFNTLQITQHSTEEDVMDERVVHALNHARLAHFFEANTGVQMNTYRAIARHFVTLLQSYTVEELIESIKVYEDEDMIRFTPYNTRTVITITDSLTRNQESFASLAFRTLGNSAGQPWSPFYCRTARNHARHKCHRYGFLVPFWLSTRTFRYSAISYGPHEHLI